MSKLAALAAILASLVVPAVAQAKAPAKPVKQYRPKPHARCRAHYVRRVETIKGRSRGHAYKARETFCVYVVPQRPKKLPLPDTPSLPSPAVRSVKLHAHLDPTFTQSEWDPTAITYLYSASATEEAEGKSAQAPMLPEGVLSLYSDGLLECAMNVGGAVTGGQCAATQGVGPHTLIATYASGTLSTAETETVAIPPFPLLPTQVKLEAGEWHTGEIDEGGG